MNYLISIDDILRLRNLNAIRSIFFLPMGVGGSIVVIQITLGNYWAALGAGVIFAIGLALAIAWTVKIKRLQKKIKSRKV